MQTKALSVVLTGFAIIIPTCPAQWSHIPVTGPPARTMFGMSYDTVRQRTVLFGGVSVTPNSYYKDTWEWDNAAWVSKSSSNRPSARSLFGMAYDERRQVTVVFGGQAGGDPFGDTWEWDGANWTQRFPTTSPPARKYAVMTYDAARARIILYGGADSTTECHDLWQWDGTTWTQATYANGPQVALGMSLTYDRLRSKGVLFGGDLGGGRYSDQLWEWDGSQWTQIILPSPATARAHAAIAANPWFPVTYVFGGTGPTLTSDTWSYDSVSWNNLWPSNRPYWRSGHQMVFMISTGRLMSFGGTCLYPCTGNVTGETWECAVPALFDSFGAGCRSSNGNVPVLTSTLPAAGQTLAIDLAKAIGLTQALLVIGLSNPELDLGPLGAPGCMLYAQPAIQVPGVTNLAGSWRVSLPIPSNPALAGLLFYDQFALRDPAANALQVVLSNGGKGLIGL